MLRARPHFLLAGGKQKVRVCSKWSTVSQSVRERKGGVEYGCFIFKRNDGGLGTF